MSEAEPMFFFNTTQMCKILGVKKRTLYKMIKNGKIKAIKTGNNNSHYRFPNTVLKDMKYIFNILTPEEAKEKMKIIEDIDVLSSD